MSEKIDGWERSSGGTWSHRSAYGYGDVDYHKTSTAEWLQVRVEYPAMVDDKPGIMHQPIPLSVLRALLAEHGLLIVEQDPVREPHRRDCIFEMCAPGCEAGAKP